MKFLFFKMPELLLIFRLLCWNVLCFIVQIPILYQMSWQLLIVVGQICPRIPVSYTHLRAHETVLDLVCRLLLEKKKNTITNTAATYTHTAAKCHT